MILRRLLILLSLASLGRPLAAEVRVDAPPVFLGFAPVIRVSGLEPRAKARLHVFRMFSRWETDDPAKRTGWKQVPVWLHAWADVQADRRGDVDIARTQVRSGTYQGRDPYGLLWSGRKPGDPLLASALVAGFDPRLLMEGEGRIVVTVGETLRAQASLRSAPPPDLRTALIEAGVLNGAYAAPADGRRHPAVILLHGSEGGDKEGALALAQRFAGQGFAAFALNYFAWDLKQIPGVPNAHVNQPIELLDEVRKWLAQQPEADVGHIGVYGHSKGAEYAAVAATHLPWIRAVAACVPSDSVWEGYGIGDPRNKAATSLARPEQMSSWSWQGKPLPYISLPPGDDRSRYYNNAAYYESRRSADPAAARLARIKVEKASARFLWLGSGRDEVWASGAMAKANHEELVRAGKGRQSELIVYQKAGHGICGDGTYPTRLWADSSDDPRRPDLDADGFSTGDAWRRIVRFLHRTLDVKPAKSGNRLTRSSA